MEPPGIQNEMKDFWGEDLALHVEKIVMLCRDRRDDEVAGVFLKCSEKTTEYP